MKRTFVELASLIGLTLLSQNLKADTLVGPGGAFQPWTAAVLGPVASPTYTSSTHPGPYWNNFSGDGPTANIGWCLTGGSKECVIASAPGAINYYATATSNAVQNMSFQNNKTPVTVSLVGQLTNQLGTSANPGYNVFGWYQINADGSIGALTSLWNSKTGAVGQSATFTPTGSYGLFMENIQGNGSADYFWFMNATQDTSTGATANPVDSSQHFAVFSGTPGDFFIGVDDTNNGNLDYNNMIIELVNVPEPRTFALFGISLALCALLMIRRKRTTAQSNEE
jgi:hypothetical protein